MKRPLDPGTAIDAKRFKRWLSHFESYRSPVTKVTIEDWLKQFKKSDRDVAARILDAVEFFGQSQIHAAYRQALMSLDGWHKAEKNRKGRWFFAAMSSSAGESGDSMLHQFRIANNLDSKAFKSLFVSRRDFIMEKLTAEDTVVLLDDFSGTGTQVCEAWTDPAVAFGELLASAGKVYLIVVAASHRARKKITDETSISLVPAHELHESDNIFSDRCKHFTEQDRDRIVHYGAIADKKQPKGFGESGFVVVFQHRTPNNSLPILHADHSKWIGLFPRHG